jgi:hypothetical protein
LYYIYLKLQYRNCNNILILLLNLLTVLVYCFCLQLYKYCYFYTSSSFFYIDSFIFFSFFLFYSSVFFWYIYSSTCIVSWLELISLSRTLLKLAFIIVSAKLFFLLIYRISVIFLCLYNWQSTIILIIRYFFLVVPSLTRYLYSKYKLV